MANILIIGAGAVSRAFSVVTSEKNYITHILGTQFDRNFLLSIKKSKKRLVNFPKRVSFYDIGQIETVKKNKYSVIIFALNSNGAFVFHDGTATRLQLNTDGHVDVTGNLDVGAGVDVTGNVVASGNVSGVEREIS